MALRKKKVLVLFDLSEPHPVGEEFEFYLKCEDWEAERDVVRALNHLDHEVQLCGIYDNLTVLLKAIDEVKPEVIFNMVESVHGDRMNEAPLVGLLELLKLPYTGSSANALMLCKNKAVSKKLLAYHRIRTPNFLVSIKESPINTLNALKFPVFVKPLRQESSSGISQASLAENEYQALERIQFIHEKLKFDAIVEEFVDGREIYVSIFGQHRLKVFPPRELLFRKMSDDQPKFATYHAKWNEKYRKKWGIKNGPAKDIPRNTWIKIERMCKKAYRVLGLDGYGRFDLRLQVNGEPMFIEANPNPAIGAKEDFALSALADGQSYEGLVDRLLDMAIQKYNKR